MGRNGKADKKEPGAPSNANALVGAAHKAWIGKRLSDPSDPLAREVARSVGIRDLRECVLIRGGESAGVAQDGGRFAALMAGEGGSETLVEISAKTCAGTGSSSQLARGWAGELLSSAEAEGVPGEVFRAFCGALGPGEPERIALSPGRAVHGNARRTLASFQSWLADPETLGRISDFAFGRAEGEARRVLLLTLRGGADGGESDLHVLASESDLRGSLSGASRRTADGRPFVRVSPSDGAVDYGIVKLKRKGGDSGSEASRHLQATLSPRELLSAAAKGTLPARIFSEERSSASMEIDELAGTAGASRESAEGGSSLSKLVEKAASRLRGQGAPSVPSGPKA